MASMLNPIRLMLLDDHPLVVQYISQLASAEKDIRVMGGFTKSRAMIEALHACSVDVVLIDFSLTPGEVDGLNLIRALRLKFPDLKILVLSATHTPATVALSMRCGADGFIGKDANTEEIMVAIRKVNGGHQYLHPAMELELCAGSVSILQTSDAALNSTPALQSIIDSSTLSARESEVLRCCLDGMTVTCIARKFSRSVKTISGQKRSAYRKLGVVTDNELFKIQLREEHGRLTEEGAVEGGNP